MRHAAIQLHQGKTRVWNRSGTLPVDVNTLGDEVWLDGIKVLGTPLGSLEFVTHQMEERLAEERRLWEAITHMPDLQYVADPAENPASQALSTVRTGA